MVREFARWVHAKTAPYPFERPIFVIAPPRSGSTFFFECLRRLAGTMSLHREADHVWWGVFPYERSFPPTDRVFPDEVNNTERHVLRRRHYMAAATSQAARVEDSPTWGHRLGFKPIRYLDKTIANCLRMDVVRSVFPDAQFVFLVRDPRANISSMIEGWSHFPKPQLSPVIESIENASVECWTYPAPPGWHEVLQRPLPEICAWSWKQHVEYALDFFDQSPPTECVHYEDLRDSPLQVIEHLSDILSVPMTDELESYLNEMPETSTTVSSPHKGKWKQKNKEDVKSVLPMIRSTARRIGYEV